jgi:hypothetical protein
MRAWVRSFTDAILGKVPSKPNRADTATRMAMDADFGDRSEPAIPPRELQRKRTRPPREPQRRIDRLRSLRAC